MFKSIHNADTSEWASPVLRRSCPASLLFCSLHFQALIWRDVLRNLKEDFYFCRKHHGVKHSLCALRSRFLQITIAFWSSHIGRFSQNNLEGYLWIPPRFLAWVLQGTKNSGWLLTGDLLGLLCINKAKRQTSIDLRDQHTGIHTFVSTGRRTKDLWPLGLNHLLNCCSGSELLLDPPPLSVSQCRFVSIFRTELYFTKCSSRRFGSHRIGVLRESVVTGLICLIGLQKSRKPRTNVTELRRANYGVFPENCADSEKISMNMWSALANKGTSCFRAAQYYESIHPLWTQQRQKYICILPTSSILTLSVVAASCRQDQNQRSRSEICYSMGKLNFSWLHEVMSGDRDSSSGLPHPSSFFIWNSNGQWNESKGLDVEKHFFVCTSWST